MSYYHVLVNYCIPIVDKDNPNTVIDTDFVRTVMDLHPSKIQQMQPSADDPVNKTFIKYWTGATFEVFHSFDEMYEVIKNVSSIDERFKIEVDSFKNDNYSNYKRITHSNRETDED